MTPPPAAPDPRYDDVAIVLHWILAAALLGIFCVGVYMADLKLSPLRVRLFNWHKWAGISILALSVLRLAWRATHPAPPAADGPAWQRRLAQGVQAALYVLFFAVPVAGWAYSSAAGFPVVWFGRLPLPDLVAPDKVLAEQLAGVHAAVAYTLAGLVVLHVAGALQHHLVRRDQVLARMLPLVRRERRP